MPNAYVVGAAVGLVILVGAGLFMWLTRPEPMTQRPRKPLRPRSRSPGNYENENCLVCTDKTACVKVHPCQHTPMCVQCTETYRKYDKRCPFCREEIESIQMPW